METVAVLRASQNHKGANGPTDNVSNTIQPNNRKRWCSPGYEQLENSSIPSILVEKGIQQTHDREQAETQRRVTTSENGRDQVPISRKKNSQGRGSRTS